MKFLARSAGALVVFVSTLGPVLSDPLVEACSEALAHYYNVRSIDWHSAQSFVDLDPPRVEMKIALPDGETTLDVIGMLMFGTQREPDDARSVRCEFASAKQPYVLGKLCPPDGCLAVTPSRLEEINKLLNPLD